MQYFLGIIIGAIAALIFNTPTKNSYKNAGAGSVYSLKQNGGVNLRVRDDKLTDTRQTVNRGYYAQHSQNTLNNMPAGGIGTVGENGPSLIANELHIQNGKPFYVPTGVPDHTPGVKPINITIGRPPQAGGVRPPRPPQGRR